MTTRPRGARSMVRRLTAALTVVVGVSIAAIVTTVAVAVRRSERAELQRNIASSVVELSELLGQSLWDVDMDRAVEIGRAYAVDPRVVRLTIREEGGATRELKRPSSGDTVARSRTVTRRGRVIGSVELVFSSTLYDQRARRQTLEAVGVGVLVLVVTLGGLRLLLGRMLHRPLGELTSTVRRYAEGDYGSHGATPGYIEFAEFGVILELMATRILAQLQTLHHTNALLADEVRDRRAAEEALRWRNHELLTLNRFLHLAATAEDGASLVAEACRELATALDLPYACALLCGESDESDEPAHVAAEYGESPWSDGAAASLEPRARALCDTIAARQSPLVLTDVRTVRHAAPLPDIAWADGVVTLVAVPLATEGVSVGAILLTAPEPRTIRAELVTLAAAVGAQVTSALARQRARAAAQLLRATVEQIPESVMIVDTGGRVVYVNPAFTTTTGYSADETHHVPPRMLAGEPADDSLHDAMWETIRAGHTWSGQFASRRKDGTHYTERAEITPIRTGRGEVTHYVRIGRDVTQELERADRMRHAQKLEAIGQLAGGIAHDFNNIVTAIQLQLELLEAEHRLVPAVSGVVSDVRASAERAANITRQLLLFSRRQEMMTRRIDLNAVVDDLLRMLTHLLGRRIAVRFERVDGAAYVDGDVGMIQQVLVNLCVNARDAMPDGGTITIRTRRLDVTDAAAVASPDAYAGRFVCLEVSDTGQGMSPETQARIFEPFFTTKDVGKGTGLGLATSHGIVVQHRGWIEVASALGVGTTFRVCLPASAPPEREQASDDALGVLVVNGEGSTRRTTARALRRLGYRVLEAGDGAEAMQLAAEHAAGLAVVVTDARLPGGVDGRALAARLRARSPRLGVVITSAAGASSDGTMPPGARLLAKPFSIAELGEAVRNALPPEHRRRS